MAVGFVLFAMNMRRSKVIMSDSILKQKSIALVIAMVGKEAASLWWSSKNKAFDMKTPTEAWLEEPERVYRYLMNHASGDYS